jgi:hypothetical protein
MPNTNDPIDEILKSFKSDYALGLAVIIFIVGILFILVVRAWKAVL